MVNLVQAILLVVVVGLGVAAGWLMHLFFGLVGVALFGVLTLATVGVVYVVQGGLGGGGGGSSRKPPGRDSKGRGGPPRGKR